MLETIFKMKELSKNIKMTNNFIKLSANELKVLKSTGEFAELVKEEELNYNNLSNEKEELVSELLNIIDNL